MPTDIRESARRLAPMPWGEAAHVCFLLARIRWTDVRLNRHYRRGRTLSDGRLLLLMERWLAEHEAIAAILRRPLPLHVEEVKAVIRPAWALDQHHREGRAQAANAERHKDCGDS